MTAPVAQRCYRHPYVETYVRCTRCGRPICTDCMVPASVGHQCPECVREGQRHQRTVTVRSLQTTPYATYVIIAACVAMLAVTGGGNDTGTLYRYGASYGPAVAAGDWWRLITPIFLHAGIFHIGFNMFALWLYGQGLERILGSARYVGLFLAAGFLGNALSMSINPGNIGVGASGAVFGVLGAWAVYFFRRRHSSAQAEGMLRGILGLIAINLLFGFTFAGIDNWAHIGGLAGGAAVGFASDDAVGHRSARATTWWSIAGIALVVAVGVVLVMVRVETLHPCRLVDDVRGLRPTRGCF